MVPLLVARHFFVILLQLKLLDGKNDRLYQFDGILPDNTNNKEVRVFIFKSILTIDRAFRK